MIELKMISLKTKLERCLRNQKTAQPILGQYGAQGEEDIITPLGLLTRKQATAQILNWITWQMKIGESTEIRLTEPNEKSVYIINIENVPRRGLIIKKLIHEPTLIGKVLHHWNKYVLSTMGVSKESISKFLRGNRFHVKLRILSPENCKQSLQVKS